MATPRTFQQVWTLLAQKMASPQVIRNWTVDKGFFGEDFTAQCVRNRVECGLPNGSEILISRSDFETV